MCCNPSGEHVRTCRTRGIRRTPRQILSFGLHLEQSGVDGSLEGKG